MIDPEYRIVKVATGDYRIQQNSSHREDVEVWVFIELPQVSSRGEVFYESFFPSLNSARKILQYTKSQEERVLKEKTIVEVLNVRHNSTN